MNSAQYIPPPERGRVGGGQTEYEPLRFRELSPVLVQHSRAMRKEPSEAEKKLWYRLRQKQLAGAKFRRQHPIGSCIVDFVCVEHGLIVELDGSQHAEQESYDQRRDAYLRQQGYRISRFWNTDVMRNIEGVLEMIVKALESPLTERERLVEGQKDSASGRHDPHLTSPLQGEEVESI